MRLSNSFMNAQPEQRISEPPTKQISDKASEVRITFYTDPLCCWSWAFENVWRKFLHHYAAEVSYRYVLCGMIPDWNTYTDDMNAVCKPLQMGPVWMHTSEVTHTPMKYSIWHEDPPASSYPSCLAVKTASLQSPKAEDLYLHAARQALMLEGKNIAKQQVLFDLAKKLHGADFDYEQFRLDWQSGRGKEAFKADLQKAKTNSIGRYPTLTFQKTGGEGIMIVGYRPLDALVQVYQHFQKAK